VPGSAIASVVLWSTAAPPFLKAVLYPADVGSNVMRSAFCRGGVLAMQVVYVRQISANIDKPVAFATELHARDRAPSLRTIEASSLIRG
jgi:hypothetical protein